MNTTYYNYILIDSNNLFWRSCLGAIKQRIEDFSNEIYSGSIQVFFNHVNKFLEVYGTHNVQVYLVFDNPNSVLNLRTFISPSYKHTRKSKDIPKEFFKSIDTLQEILLTYKNNFFVCKSSCCEADDLIYPIRNKLNITSDKKALLISADLDWARQIEENIHWFNYADLYTAEKFKKKWGFNPIGNSIKLYKAIHGDNSDCIDNAVPHLPSEILLDLVERFKDVDDLFANLTDSPYPPQWKQKIRVAENQVRINYQLVDFILVEQTNENIITPAVENLKILKNWFSILSIPLEPRMCDTNDPSSFFTVKNQRKKIL